MRRESERFRNGDVYACVNASRFWYVIYKSAVLQLTRHPLALSRVCLIHLQLGSRMMDIAARPTWKWKDKCSIERERERAHIHTYIFSRYLIIPRPERRESTGTRARTIAWEQRSNIRKPPKLRLIIKLGPRETASRARKSRPEPSLKFRVWSSNFRRFATNAVFVMPESGSLVIINGDL